jgi:hypothetical protein
MPRKVDGACFHFPASLSPPMPRISNQIIGAGYGIESCGVSASRATAETLAPGSSVAATSRCFAARLKRRRFRTNGMMSFGLFFM